MYVPVLFALLCIVLALAAYLTFHIQRLAHNTFTDRGVVFRRPWPIAGDFGKLLLGQKSLVDLLHEHYIDFKAIG